MAPSSNAQPLKEAPQQTIAFVPQLALAQSLSSLSDVSSKHSCICTPSLFSLMQSTHWALVSRSEKKEITLHNHLLGTMVSIFIHKLCKLSQQFYVLSIYYFIILYMRNQVRRGSGICPNSWRCQLASFQSPSCPSTSCPTLYIRWVNEPGCFLSSKWREWGHHPCCISEELSKGVPPCGGEVVADLGMCLV